MQATVWLYADLQSVRESEIHGATTDDGGIDVKFLRSDVTERQVTDDVFITKRQSGITHAHLCCPDVLHTDTSNNATLFSNPVYYNDVLQ